MRHKKQCLTHKGTIASCRMCKTVFTVQDIIKRALDTHFGSNIHGEGYSKFDYPEKSVPRLNYQCYEDQKNFSWYSDVEESKESCLRRFAANVAVNSHFPTHTTRCFKKGDECFANLPEAVSSSDHFVYCEKPDVWSDFMGLQSIEYMFTLQPKRDIGDVFMNRNNDGITQLLCCNNNVTFGISGRAVMYVTGYQVKSQQKEEQMAFQLVAQVICRMLQRDQTLEDPLSDDHRVGFRRLLAGIYSHTGTHIVAAPMARHLALVGSRFQYSHDAVYLPCYGLQKMLENEFVIMSYKTRNKKTYITHKALDYLHRPVTCENECLYSYFEGYQVVATSKLDVMEERYELLESHPMAECQSVVMRKGVKAVPVFSWSWLGNTSSFLTSLHTDPDETSPDFKSKEEYCFKFMILFLPFRSLGDMTSLGTYQATFLEAKKSGQISDEMFTIADHIVSLANSHASQVPPNLVSLETELAESGPSEIDNQEFDNMQRHQQMAKLYQYLASSAFQGLEAEPVSFNFSQELPPEINLQCTAGTFSSDIQSEPLLHFDSSTSAVSEPEHTTVNATRFVSCTSELNSIVFSKFNDLSTDHAADIENEATPLLIVEPINNGVIASGSWKSIVDWSIACGLDKKQQMCFHILASTYVLSFMEEARNDWKENDARRGDFETNIIKLRMLARRALSVDGSPLRLFVTGPAGAGKSAILKEFITYAKSFSLMIDHEFTQGTIRLTALTGAAACEIGGTTSHSEFQIAMHKGVQKRDISNDSRISFKDTRMIIIDEISFADASFLEDLDSNLRELTEDRDTLMGKFPVVMLGDFRQLEPIGKHSLYREKTCVPWWLGVNCMVELEGKWRFVNDPVYGEIMDSLRKTGLSDEHRCLLNSRVVGSYDPQNIQRGPLQISNPNMIQYAVCYNKSRDAINQHLYERYLATYHSNATAEPGTIPLSAVVIKAGAVWSSTKQKLCFGQRKVLFEKCGESEVKSADTRCDPFLKLYKGCPLMSNQNKDVRNGIANGTTAVLDKVVLRPGVRLMPIQVNGYWVNSVDAADVDHLQLKWIGGRFQGRFRLESQGKNYKVRFPLDVGLESQRRKEVGIKLQQFPVVINHATTVHKLQGKSLDELVVVEWANKGMKNWFYVALSRVKSLAGLFLMAPVPVDLDFEPNEEYLDMMEYFRTKVLATDEQVLHLFEGVVN